jgi:DNA-binding helix-hairpin-helix protein with protein kinase domain
LDHDPRPVAIKWYYLENIPGNKEAQYFNLQKVVQMKAPDKNFLWPLDLATSPDVAGFGYIMPLREKRFKSIIDWMYRRVNPSFRSLLTTGYELSNSFFNLHAMGTCYRDISFGNMFFDPATGDITICDNDNVAADPKAGSLVLGTPDFMAPEVVRREVVPSIDTDLFSLAVLLFYIFFIPLTHLFGIPLRVQPLRERIPISKKVDICSWQRLWRLRLYCS